ncbi:hypothetical protein DERF_009942 [Dermatophagoides farinae]|uniref:Uncharacterized protein n=1 Tax=Dermatophagoides farinae TaxID=6954 RepID=A0A922HVZ5_DERFA|nr:hypothetical protein DERF_009942 [Dermatophagoides farinae]
MSQNEILNQPSSSSYPYFQRFINPLLSGACAGLAVDVTLFPIDTIKTRLQSANGFWKSGGFTRIYSGIGSTVSGSAPGAALFFITYESGKYLLSGQQCLHLDSRYNSVAYMISASMGEIVACLVRVPVEVVKQRAQAFHMNSVQVLQQTLRQSGWPGLYRGYASTIMREIPFSMIQFSLWEHTKQAWANWQQTSTTTTTTTAVEPYQAMICGSFSGAIAAFLTTPLDVAKTQIMLQDFGGSSRSIDNNNKSVPIRYFHTIRSIFKHKGLQGLWAGALPRVVWISIGGAIFLGGYEWVHTSLEKCFIQ